MKLGKVMSKEGRENISRAKMGTTEDKCNAWKGDSAGYRAIHLWVATWKGKAEHCEVCGDRGRSLRCYHWANIDHKYRRVLDDYISMCVRCHKKFDKDNNLKIKTKC